MLGAINYQQNLKLLDKVIPRVQGKFKTAPTSSSSQQIVTTAEFLDSNNMVFMYNYSTTYNFYKLNVAGNEAQSPTLISSTVYTDTSNGYVKNQMLVDKLGDGNIWIVNVNPSDYGLYYYNGSTLTKKLSDSSAAAYLAYKSDGTLMYKSSASNYYKCLNGVVTVDTNPSLASLGGYYSYHPNGGDNQQGLVFNDGSGALISSEDNNFNLNYLPITKTIDANLWNTSLQPNTDYACSIFNANSYMVMSTLCTVVNSNDTLQSIKTIVVKNPGNATSPAPLMELPTYQYRIGISGTSILNMKIPACKARYVQGEGLYVYHYGIVYVVSGSHYMAMHETFYPIDLNF